MGSVYGGTRETLITNLPCVHALMIDYSTHIVYWADTCRYEFQSISLDGDQESLSYPFTQIVFFVSSVAKFNDNLYWVQPSGIYTMTRAGEDFRVLLSASSNRRPVSMEIVHPSHQPEGVCVCVCVCVPLTMCLYEEVRGEYIIFYSSH